MRPLPATMRDQDTVGRLGPAIREPSSKAEQAESVRMTQLFEFEFDNHGDADGGCGQESPTKTSFLRRVDKLAKQIEAWQGDLAEPYKLLPMNERLPAVLRALKKR